MSATPHSGSLETLRAITGSILEPGRPAYSLRQEVQELVSLLAELRAADESDRDDISKGETLTAQGLAISPRMAAMCAEDFARTVVFLRGMHAAIPRRPARILYAGCGPYAILSLPLMALFEAAEAVFTLLDMHAESIDSVRSIVGKLGIGDRVEHMRTIDVLDYRVDANRPPDILLMEIMRSTLEIEPQVAVTRHLLAQAAEAITIPETIDIDLRLVDVAREFDRRDSGSAGSGKTRGRIEVGRVFTLDRNSVRDWAGNASDRLPGGRLTIPDFAAQRHQPMLFTTIRVYGNHWLREYDSGLTYPRMLNCDRPIEPGASIGFYYRLGRDPRLLCE